jgi:hypothetical protein
MIDLAGSERAAVTQVRNWHVYIGSQRRTSLLGVNLAPRGETCPLGEMFTPSLRSPPGVNTLYVLKNGGVNRQFHPQGITSPQGTKFTPGWQLHPWGQNLPVDVNLRMGLCVTGFSTKSNERSSVSKCISNGVASLHTTYLEKHGD